MVALSAACFREHQFASSIEVHMKLIDTPNSVIGKVAKLKGLGVSGIIRYVSPNTASFPNKRVTASEIRECARFGVWVGLVWEVAGTASEMSAAIGKVHAAEAVKVAQALKLPKAKAIGFAVDYDAPQSDLPAVLAYFKAVHNELSSAGYLVTVYGSGLVMDKVIGAGFAHYGWLSQSMGWSGSKAEAKEVILQGQTTTVAGIDVDVDTLVGAAASDPNQAGLWLPTA